MPYMKLSDDRRHLVNFETIFNDEPYRSLWIN